jgi:hypothetical protein
MTYQSFHDRQLEQFLENPGLNARQVRTAMEYTERLKAQDAAVIQKTVIEGRQATAERASKAAAMATEAKDRLMEVEAKLRRREIAPSKAARVIAAERRELERLRTAAASYEREAALQEDQWAEPLRHADAVFVNAPVLQADRPDVFDLGTNF